MKYRVIEKKDGFHAQEWFDIEDYRSFWDKLLGIKDTTFHGWATLDIYGLRWTLNSRWLNTAMAVFKTEQEAIDFIKELKRESPERVCVEL